MVDYSHFSPSLQIALKRLEDIWGGELPAINSGYRDPATNAKAGGAKGSQHLHGNAIDWATAGMSQDERLRFLDATRKAGFQGFGGYSSGNIHTDVGPARYWGDDYSGKSAPQWLRDWYSGSPSGPRISAKDYNMAMNKQEEEQGFDLKGGLLSFADALNNLILPAARNQNTAGQLAEYQKQKEQVRSANKTAAYFESIGRNDLAQLVRERAISGRDAFSTYTQEQAAARSLAAQQAARAEDRAFQKEMFGMRTQADIAGDERKYSYDVKLAELKTKLGDDKTTALIRNAKAAGLVEGTPEFSQYVLSGGDIYSKEVALLSSLPKPPAGQYYDFQRDASGNITGFSLKNIKGGEKDIEADQLSQAQIAKDLNVAQSGMIVLEDINRAIEIATEDPILSTGLVGSILRQFGGTQAKTLDKLTTTIKANIGFDRLQRMRDESPTGGALGQVAVQELEALQSTLGSLDTSLDDKELVKNLKRLDGQYRSTMKRVYDAAIRDQERGLVNKNTGRVVSPTDYFTQSDIDMLTGKAGASNEDLLKKYGG